MKNRLLIICVCLLLCLTMTACRPNMEEIEREYYSLSGFVKEIFNDELVMIINAYPVKYDCAVNTERVRYDGDIESIAVGDYITVYFDLSQFDHYEDAKIYHSIIILKQDELPQDTLDLGQNNSDEEVDESAEEETEKNDD